MNITELAIKKDRVTIVFMLLLFAYGVISFYNLPRAKDPGFIIRTATVVTHFPGASSKRVEQLVTERLEKVIQEIPEIDFIKSTSKKGVSIIFVNIKEKYKNLRPIWDSLRRKVQKAEQELPSGVGAPIVNDEFGDVFGTLIAIEAEGYSFAEKKEVADDIRDVFLRLDEVAKVDIIGNQEERMYVEFDNAKLAKFGLSASKLQNILAGQNIVISGGEIRIGQERIGIEPTGNFDNLEELKQTVIPLENGVIYLQDIAHVYAGYENPSSMKVHTNGKDAIILAISMKKNGDILKLGEAVQKELALMQAKYPIGVELEIVFFESGIVKKIVDDFVGNLLQAIGLVIVVMLFSLGLRTGLIVAVLIPMSILSALIVMDILDIWLDQVSLAALIISLGLLVDAAIVMSESIMVLMQRGKSALEASVISSKELKVPLLTSTLTTAAAFLPIFLAESNTGEYTASIFKVVTITLLSSWLLALTLTPVLSFYFMKVKPQEEQFQGLAYSLYQRILEFALRFKYLSLLFVLVIFVFSMMQMKNVPKLFFPPTTEKSFTIELSMPMATSIEKTEYVVSEIENFLKKNYLHKEVLGYSSFIGEGAPRYWISYSPEMSSPETAYMIINTISPEENAAIMKAAEAYANERFPDIDIKAKLLANGPGVNKPIEVRLSGKSETELFHLADEVKTKLASFKGVKNISDDWGIQTKKIIIDIHKEKALRAGITNQDIAVSLQTALSGYETSQFRIDDKLIPIMLRSKDDIRQNVERLESINVYAQQTGVSVPLEQVASVKVAYEPSKILRRDRLKTVTVSAEINKDANALEVFAKLSPWMKQFEKERFDIGYYYEYGGEYEANKKSQDSIMVKMPFALMAIILLMVLQFNSIRKPVIILSTIPLGLIGVVWGLLIAKSYFGFMTLLGVISLAGIVINNAIVLLERIKIEEDENGLSPDRAIVQASLSRFRPIFLTTVTTVFGLIPLWLNGGAMWEPMAVAIIFGLLFATVLTLGFVPILYAIFYRVKV